MKINTTLLLVIAFFIFCVGLAVHSNGEEFDTSKYGLPWKVSYVDPETQPRLSIRVYANGDHILVPTPGECDPMGCVISENYTEQWDGLKWIRQMIDNDYDGGCDVVRVWKPIADPTYGVFYGIERIETCGGSI